MICCCNAKRIPFRRILGKDEKTEHLLLGNIWLMLHQQSLICKYIKKHAKQISQFFLIEDKPFIFLSFNTEDGDEKGKISICNDVEISSGKTKYLNENEIDVNTMSYVQQWILNESLKNEKVNFVRLEMYLNYGFYDMETKKLKKENFANKFCNIIKIKENKEKLSGKLKEFFDSITKHFEERNRKILSIFNSDKEKIVLLEAETEKQEIILERRMTRLIKGFERFRWEFGATNKILNFNISCFQHEVVGYDLFIVLFWRLKEDGFNLNRIFTYKTETNAPFSHDYRENLSNPNCFRMIANTNIKISEKSKNSLRMQLCHSVDENQLNTTEFERMYVHDVYDRIAHHFSHTRYKAWPKVCEFLLDFNEGSVIIDVGSGNGKYLNYNKKTFNIGVDRSLNLLRISRRNSSSDVFQTDCLKTSFRDGIADGCISIAVIHHLNTFQRRLDAVKELVRCTKVGGRILLYVWSNNHEDNSVGCRKFESNDVFVPWKLSLKNLKCENEIKRDCSKEQNNTIMNYSKNEHLNVTSEIRESSFSQNPLKPKCDVFKRYYHVFSKDELLHLCKKVTNVSVQKCYFDTNNWAVILYKKSK